MLIVCLHVYIVFLLSLSLWHVDEIQALGCDNSMLTSQSPTNLVYLFFHSVLFWSYFEVLSGRTGSQVTGISLSQSVFINKCQLT